MASSAIDSKPAVRELLAPPERGQPGRVPIGGAETALDRGELGLGVRRRRRRRQLVGTRDRGERRRGRG